MLQTAWGSLHVGVNAQPGETLLVRGGTSSIGMAIAVLAIGDRVRVISTTRSADRVKSLRALGIEHVVIDGGRIADEVRDLTSGGIDGAVELVGTNTLPDTLKATRRGGVVCFTGMLSDQWTIPDFYPMDYIPNGVRLTAYHGEAVELTPLVLEQLLDAVAAGSAAVPIGHVYRFDEIVQAHHDMERGTFARKARCDDAVDDGSVRTGAHAWRPPSMFRPGSAVAAALGAHAIPHDWSVRKKGT